MVEYRGLIDVAGLISFLPSQSRRLVPALGDVSIEKMLVSFQELLLVSSYVYMFSVAFRHLLFCMQVRSSNHFPGLPP